MPHAEVNRYYDLIDLLAYPRHSMRLTELVTPLKPLEAMAERFDVSETEVVHMALSRMAKEELPAYEADDGPLTTRDAKLLRKISDTALPRGKVVRKQSLF